MLLLLNVVVGCWISHLSRERNKSFLLDSPSVMAARFECPLRNTCVRDRSVAKRGVYLLRRHVVQLTPLPPPSTLDPSAASFLPLSLSHALVTAVFEQAKQK